MNDKAFHAISYGLFVLTANEGGFDNGCIINTAIQAASTPRLLTVCVNKTNYTAEMIQKTGKFNISVLSEDAVTRLYLSAIEETDILVFGVPKLAFELL